MLKKFWLWEKKMSKKFTEDAMWVLNSVYYMKDPKKITKEIEEGRFWKISDIKSSLGNGDLTPNFEKEFKEILINLNNKNPKYC